MAIIAKQRLATSRLSIQEISAELGFAHSSGFHRAFKRLTGMTPVEFRRRVRTEELAEGLCG
jgi:AraC-like DNA-binding protein